MANLLRIDLGAWILHSGLCPRPIVVLCTMYHSDESRIKERLGTLESIYDVSKLVTVPPRSLSHRDLERRGRGGRSGPPPEAKVLPTEHALSPKRKDTYGGQECMTKARPSIRSTLGHETPLVNQYTGLPRCPRTQLGVLRTRGQVTPYSVLARYTRPEDSDKKSERGRENLSKSARETPNKFTLTGGFAQGTRNDPQASQVTGYEV